MAPTLVQAAEAVLRCALEHALEQTPQDLQRASAQEASSCRMSAACEPLSLPGLYAGHAQHA